MSDALQRKARRLVWLLRHGAESVGLSRDEAGFIDVDIACEALRLSREDLSRIIRRDNKSRFELRGDRLRAAQGQSAGPVSPDALESSWGRYAGEGPLWHATNRGAIPGIARDGLLPMARTHVHLATHPDSVVGKRAGAPLMLGVSPALLAEAGLPVFLSANGVALVRAVPVGCLTELRGPDAEALATLFNPPIRAVEAPATGARRGRRPDPSGPRGAGPGRSGAGGGR